MSGNCENPLFWETVRLLHRMKLNKLVDEVTYQTLDAELHIYKNCGDSCHQLSFLKYLFIVCANVPYFEMKLPIGWYKVYIQDNREKIEQVELRALMVYDEYLRKIKEYYSPENVEKRRLEFEKRKKETADMNARLGPRIMYDIMRQSENGIIFPDIL
jgi:hypothetical protein